MTRNAKKIVDFPKAEVDPEERARRLKVEVERLANLPPVEWMLYLSEGVAEKHGVDRADMKKMIEATIKAREKKARRRQGRRPPASGRDEASVPPLYRGHSHIFARAENDHYVEPLWCARRLFAVELFGVPRARVLDPACGWGRMLRDAKDAGYIPIGGDIVDRLQRRELGLLDIAFNRRDFLTAPVPKHITSVICNSPFERELLRRFCERALDTASFRVAMLSRLARVVAAHHSLAKLPLQKIYLMTPRPSMPSGDFILSGGKVQGDRQEYCWLVFDHRVRIGSTARLHWLHRDGDAQ